MDFLSVWGWFLPYLLLACVLIAGAALLRRTLRKAPPQSRYVEALNALLDGDEEKALEDLRETVLVEKTNIDAFLRLGNLLRRKGDIDRALRIHRDLNVGTFFRRKLTPDEQFRIREAIADDYLAGRRSDEALHVLDDLLKRNKTNWRIRSKMVSIYERRSDWDQAFRLYREGLRIRKENAPERIARYRAFCGASLLEAGDREKAEKVFEDALRIDPNCPEALFRLGTLCFEAGNQKEAIGYWERFHEVAPGMAFLTFDRFEESLFEIGDLNRIEAVYKKILEEVPSEERTLLSLSTFHARRGERGEAIDLARRAAETHPDSVVARDRLTLLLLREENHSPSAVAEVRTFLEDRKPRETHLACSQCRYSAVEPFWRCPRCLNWYTAKPELRETVREPDSPSSFS